MQKNNIHILSTRPIDKALINEAAKYNIVIDEISFINTEAIINDGIKRKINKLSKQDINVVYTSMTAVNAVNRYLPAKTSWKIFCIGNTTKNLVEKFFGRDSIAETAENASQLAEKIIGNKLIKAVTFFCGDNRRNELPEKLTTNNIAVEEIIVYKTIKKPKVVNQEYDAILFYSPSAVNSFFLKNTVSNRAHLFAIGPTTADAIKHFTQQPVIITELPGKKNLVTLAINHFSKSKIS